MTAGSLSAVNLTKAYLQRIALHQHRGPVDQRRPAINPKALEEAAARDAERAAGTVRGPLHGIPVMVKDNLDAAGHADHGGLASRWRTRSRTATRRSWPSCARRARSCSASSTCPSTRTSSPTADAERLLVARRPGAEPLQRRHHAERLVERLRRRGRRRPGARSRSAPRRPARSRSPADDQGVVGLRPTVGLVSRTGILPISATQDTAGPDDPHRRRRGRRARRDRRQGPGGPGDRDGARHGARTTSPASRRRRWPGKRIGVINNNNAQYVGGGRRDPGARRDDGQVADAERAAARARSCSRSSSATSPRTSSRLPASAPMKTLADVIAYNNANADDALKYGQAHVRCRPGHGPDRPGAERRLRHDPRQRPPQRAAGDRQRAHPRHGRPGRRPRGDHDPGGRR